MPEYLHPGVYIEETSYRGKPIQGVSTSTAGFVGATRKGPEGRAVFVPSFPHFRRIFGDPVSPTTGLGDYLGHSVRAFFDNGGARCYVVRVLANDALASTIDVEQGIALRRAPGVTVRGPTRTLRLNALRGVGNGSALRVFTRPDANSPFSETRSATVESCDAQRGSVTVVAADEIPSGVALEPSNTVILINGTVPNAVAPVGGGARFTAHNRGVDGDRIAVEIRPRDRPPVALTSASANRQDPLLDLDAGGSRRRPGRPRCSSPCRPSAPAARRRHHQRRRLDRAGRAGGPGGDFSGGGTIRLSERGGTASAPRLSLAPRRRHSPST